MLDARVEFIKVFVEADLQYEDFDSTQLEVFIDQAVDLGIEIESVVDEREFYRIKRIINDMYEVYQEEDFDTNCNLVSGGPAA